ncbi:coproporphyrinogen dehydrogenase HemZ [Anaerophilus nitritogenes]|uniref:coproporphyrinogen dehydrogenase HemZ n=1 Tax=Anaerophilus nitritogenes TaxID=2498136 RepID=UPI00101E01CE|nr:coproporphyrinogen dehydrogenase HemZ [Anaerophilus nitritogenes]
MINVLLKGHNFEYEVGELLKIFIHKKDFKFVQQKALEDNQSFLLVSEYIKDQNITKATLLQNEKVLGEKFIYHEKINNSLKLKKMIKRSIKIVIYDILREFYDIAPPWGILTGIRPTKIVHELFHEGLNIEKIKKRVKDDYRMSDEKIDLIINIAQIEKKFIHGEKEDQVSVYISIPFCPTRCLYCSFPSHPYEEEKIKDYLNALCYEIKEIGNTLKKLNKKVETLYIGGGTPTTLTAEQLDTLLKTIHHFIDLKYVKEMTVEAGRPDTITKEKLEVLKRNKINRISINPQTMNDETLIKIGRHHKVQDIIDTYEMAKEIGFDSINMDLIIGLPGEDEKMVEHTMKEIQRLDPNNLTVHTLAIKRTSRLKESIKDYDLAKEEQVQKMIHITQDYAKKMGLIPYYMYRQKYMLGNLENIGYSKENYECIYNIQIMEEKQSIIALGAGGVSKFFYPKENRLERVPNVTNVDEYIKRIDEMIERKRKEFFIQNGNNIDR